MVKYLAIAAALMASLVIAEQAQARGRRGGCSSCGGGYVANGCPGGVCAVPVAPAKHASIDNAPPGLASAPAVAAPVLTTQPATNNYYYNASAPRRGLFGRR